MGTAFSRLSERKAVGGICDSDARRKLYIVVRASAPNLRS